MKRIPVVPTLIVLIAVGYMIHLGFWQLDRLKQKEAMLARYVASRSYAGVLDLSATDDIDRLAYRHVRWGCPETGNDQLVAGRNAAGESGWAHVVVCTHFGFDYGDHAAVVLGWSRDLAPVVWRGGALTGVVIPGPKSGVKMPNERRGPPSAEVNLPFHIVADPPLAGLQPNAKPDPRDIPNNHLAYAVQWFLFAGVALVIYAMALRKRMRAD
jgi:surfeit locus 1 family protein